MHFIDLRSSVPNQLGLDVPLSTNSAFVRPSTTNEVDDLARANLVSPVPVSKVYDTLKLATLGVAKQVPRYYARAASGMGNAPVLPASFSTTTILPLLDSSIFQHAEDPLAGAVESRKRVLTTSDRVGSTVVLSSGMAVGNEASLPLVVDNVVLPLSEMILLHSVSLFYY